MLVFVEEGKPENSEKEKLGARREPARKLNPHMAPGWNRARATLVKSALTTAHPCSTNMFKDVRAHCYCASPVRTIYMTWRVPRHVFQARAPSRNSTKYRADDFYVNLVLNIFVGYSVTPTFFRQITSFSGCFHCTKKTKKYMYVGNFNRFSYTIQKRPNLNMDTGVRD